MNPSPTTEQPKDFPPHHKLSDITREQVVTTEVHEYRQLTRNRVMTYHVEIRWVTGSPHQTTEFADVLRDLLRWMITSQADESDQSGGDSS